MKQSDYKLLSTSLQITPMIGIFEREKDESRIKRRVSKNASTLNLIDNKQTNNSAQYNSE